MSDNVRCVNLDWLEVCCCEPIDQPHDAEYFRACGWLVVEREYGTRVWGQMFTIEGTDHLPFLEVRREPKSQVIAVNICHLRFVNRVCYFENAAQLMSQFIDRYGYTFHHITRVDICLDFEYFDYGDLPRDFMRRFMQGKYSKINQANISLMVPMTGQVVFGTLSVGVLLHQTSVRRCTIRRSNCTTP